MIAGLLLASLTAAVGCDRGGTSGGPGATASSGKAPFFGQADDTFKLSTSSVSMKQGDAVSGAIGIKRGTNFDQDVTLALTELPMGVTVDPAGPVIPSKGTDVKFTLTASDAAVPGEYVVQVVGHPAKGGDATNSFKLSLAKKDTFTLSMPFWTTALKQGEAKAVSIAIDREKRFDQDVTLKFEGLPKGVTVEPADAVIKNGTGEAKFVVKAADDAALGDFAVKVTGHPTKGADATHEFKFTVAKK
jgi:hypothetical protein